jgi:transcriptional regulator with XRE-family HTH domain
MSKRINDRNPHFGNNVKILRKQYNISQGELAVALGVGSEYGPQVVSAWENNYREPTFNTLTKIADYFGVSTDFLLGRVRSPFRDRAEQLIIRAEENIKEEDKERLLALIKLYVE